MAKTNNKRVDQAIQAILSVVGQDEADDIQSKYTRHPQKPQLAAALSIGGVRGPFPSPAESQKRNLIRALLLTGLIQNKLTLTTAGSTRTQLSSVAASELERRLVRAFPFKPFAGQFAERQQWAPSNFTTPVAGLATNYQFMVHSIMVAPSKVADFGFGSNTTKADWDRSLTQYRSGISAVQVTGARTVVEKKQLMVNFAKQYLQDITIVQRGIVSASIIDQNHHASYYPFGFILKVPPECIYSTASRDQEVKNRAQSADASGKMQSAVVGELGRIHAQARKGGGKISSPATILAGTRGVNGRDHYNEIVLVGRSPEGKMIEVVGLFVKCHPNGNHYVEPTQTKPYLDSTIIKYIKGCSSTKGIPIVKIIDRSSAASTTAMDF